MKRFLEPLMSSGWLSTRWTSRLPIPGRQAPWYRRLWQNRPLTAAILMAPFALYMGWRAIALLRSEPVQDAPDTTWV